MGRAWLWRKSVKPSTGLFERFRPWVLSLHFGAVAAAVLALAPVWSHAANTGSHDSAIQKIEKLLKEGRQAEADKEIQLAQSVEGGHFRLKFLQCVVQAQQGASKKAISCFQQWAQEHSDVPEAYNNIGVLYAGMGMHVEARKWFEQGIKQQQAYATLHQNLLNLQAEMNRPAYAAALQLDMAKQASQPKLSLLGRITSVPDQAAPSVASAAAIAKTAASTPNKPSAAAPPAEPVVALPVAKSKPSEASAVSPAPAPEQAVASAEDLAQQSRVQEAVSAWASAWREKDVEAYLQFYAPGFNPGSRISRSAWEEQRRARILSKKQIQLELTQFKIRVSAGHSTATATFVQRYESGAVVTVSRKTLEMVKDQGRWLIVREFVIGA